MNAWEQWLEERRKASTMKTNVIDLATVRQWETTTQAVQRPDGGYFKVLGMNITTKKNEREVNSWDQPMIEETGEGAVVLICSFFDDEFYFLLQAKAEPGNDAEGCVLLAPTLQASKSNLEAIHGGKKPPRSELVTEDLKWYTFLQDGGRYYHKKNHYAVVDIDPDVDEKIEPTANERWFTFNELQEAVLTGYANEHLIQAFLVWNIVE